MRVGDLVQTIGFGSVTGKMELGVIVDIVKQIRPMSAACFKVLMAGNGETIQRWEGDVEVINESR